MRKTVGQIIKDIRTELNLTQKEFADKLGFSCKTVSSWEKGRSNPDIFIVQMMHRIFNMDYYEFFDFYNPKLDK